MISVLDTICKSEDKERLVPVVQAVWANTSPFLRLKHHANAMNFAAASKLLAAIT